MMKLDLTRKGNGIELPLPLWTETSEARSWRVGVRGYGLSIDRNPSPGSHPAMRSDLSHKGRGEVRPPAEPIQSKPSRCSLRSLSLTTARHAAACRCAASGRADAIVYRESPAVRST